MKFSKISIIYNPNSTGSSVSLAHEFKDMFDHHVPDIPVELIGTERAGHAAELAYEIARESSNPFIISSSGDGGYSEVVNGVMKAKSEGFNSSTGLIPAGNANDHYHRLHEEGSLVDRVSQGKPRLIDVLKLTIETNGKKSVSYAHSYVGLGLSSEAGDEMNRNDLNPIKEVILAGRVFFSYRPVELEVDGVNGRYDSLIFSNIDRMSKYLTMSKSAQIDDGLFEVNISRYQGRFKLLKSILKSTVGMNSEDMQLSSFEFKSSEDILIQADGETIEIVKGSIVKISSERQALSCIV